MTSEMVMAWGENGMELTPREETVEIEEVPLGAGNIVTPATVRWMTKLPAGGRVPTRIRKIERPSKKNGQRFVRVDFDCTPFVRYTNADGSPAMGNWSSCVVRNLSDANDPIFSDLSDRERTRIVRAIEVSSRKSRQ